MSCARDVIGTLAVLLKRTDDGVRETSTYQGLGIDQDWEFHDAADLLKMALSGRLWKGAGDIASHIQTDLTVGATVKAVDAAGPGSGHDQNALDYPTETARALRSVNPVAYREMTVAKLPLPTDADLTGAAQAIAGWCSRECGFDGFGGGLLAADLKGAIKSCRDKGQTIGDLAKWVKSKILP